LFEKANVNCYASPFFNKFYFDIISGRGCKLHLIYVFPYCFFRRLKSLLFARKYDLIVIEKEIIPYFPLIFERLLLLFHVKFILDFDDAIFHNYTQSKHWTVRKLFANKISTIIRLSNGIIAGNSYLANYAKAHNPSVVEIPTAIDLKKYPNIPVDSDSFIVGWIGGKSTSHYVENLLPLLEKFANNHNDVEIKLIGFVPSMNHSYDHVKIIKWREDKEIDEINSISVGIMPLDNTLWSNGKCGFKLIQYMACFKPTISTPLQANLDIDGKIGNLFARNDAEWYASLTTIINDREKYRRIGVENKKRIETAYSIQSNYNLIFKFIKNVVYEK
jgi:glycosyltransferase involved in cell wall biosynthesis